MKRAEIGIPYPTHTAPVNFETSDNCCGVLTYSLLNREALDIRSHSNQLRYVIEAGWEKRMDRNEGGTRALKTNADNKSKRNMEQACKVGGCITVLLTSQGGTDLLREDFRDTLWWRLDLTHQNTPLTCDGYRDSLTANHTYHCKRGEGLVDNCHNLLKEECVDM